MDSVTQSAQISSSGFADGHNSAAKESKLSDSFLSSSPVSLIQSPQDKRIAPGSPFDGVATSLRFPSQSGSFTLGHYGSEAGLPDGQPDSLIKTSPVSERIKALEALAAKKKESDFRSDGGFPHSKDRHNEKSPTDVPKSPIEKVTPTVQKKRNSAHQESPESPFEILGDLRQGKEFEETEEWMKAHLPPVPNLDYVNVLKDNVASKEEKDTDKVAPDALAFAGVPDAFMDSPVVAPKLEGDRYAQRQLSIEEESEFDLSFLPKAYMWDQEEKCVQAQTNSEPERPASPGPPPANCDTKHSVLVDKKNAMTSDPEPPEASEAESSGESDETIIEHGAPMSVSFRSSDPAGLNGSTPATPDIPTEITPLLKSERKLMQVPTINVIETDEPNYSDEVEMELEAEEHETFEVIKESTRDAAKTSEPEDDVDEPPEADTIETEIVQGYSPPSSPLDSDAEYSPEHKIFSQGAAAISEDSTPDLSQILAEKSQATSSKASVEPSLFSAREEARDDDDEWSDEGQCIFVTSDDDHGSVPYIQSKVEEADGKEAQVEMSVSKTNLMQDDVYNRQLFDYDFDQSSSLDNLYDKGQSGTEEHLPSDGTEVRIENLNEDFLAETLTSLKEHSQDQFSKMEMTSDAVSDNITNGKNVDSVIRLDTAAAHHKPETSHPECTDSKTLSSGPTDSFVEFMRECMKSRQAEEANADGMHQNVPPKSELCKTSLAPVSLPTPTMVMDLEQEELTISALKELGSSQEEEAEPSFDPLSQQPLSFTSASNPPRFQSSRSHDGTYSKEVEAIDEWVAEACHLAEHVLMAILTHLSVKDLIHWRDPRKSGLLFGLSMLLLLSLAAFSIISVVSYLLLALLCVTITFRIYKSVVQAVQKSSEGHPFKTLIDKDVSIPPETFRKHVDASLTYINQALKQMSRLFLVEDLVDSLKLAVAMWLLTYVGAVFNGITILILADILLFAIPPVYEKNKTQIDQYIDVARTQINSTIAKLQEKLPGAMKRKTE